MGGDAHPAVVTSNLDLRHERGDFGSNSLGNRGFIEGRTGSARSGKIFGSSSPVLNRFRNYYKVYQGVKQSFHLYILSLTNTLPMAFKLLIVKAIKPAFALGALATVYYGTYEWNKAKNALHLDPRMSEEQMIKVFNEIDTSHDGFISEKELHDALEAKGLRIGKFGMDAMMKAADENHDGSISKEEWIHMIKTMHANPSMHVPEKHLAKGNKYSPKHIDVDQHIKEAPHLAPGIGPKRDQKARVHAPMVNPNSASAKQLTHIGDNITNPTKKN